MSRCRGYFFTCWNVDDDVLIQDWPNSPNWNCYSDALLWCSWQIERCPTSGKLHAQGACWFKDGKTPQAGRAYFNETPQTMYYFAPIANIKGAHEYVNKEESRVWGPWTVGELPEDVGRGARTDLDRDFKLALEGAVSDVSASSMMRYTRGVMHAFKIGNELRWGNVLRKLEVHVLWGKPGAGKSMFYWNKYADAYRGATPRADGTMWFNGYREQNVIILDDFPPKREVDYTWFLKLLDSYPFQVETKGDTLWAAWSVVAITSMVHPQKWFKNEDFRALERRITTCTEVTGNIEAMPTVTEEVEDTLETLDY